MDFYFETEERSRDGLRVRYSLSFYNESYREFYGRIFDLLHNLRFSEGTVIRDREGKYGWPGFSSIGQVWGRWELPNGDGWDSTQGTLDAIEFKKTQYPGVKTLTFSLDRLYDLDQNMGWEFVKCYLIVSLFNNGFLEEFSDIALTIGNISPIIEVVTNADYK